MLGGSVFPKWDSHEAALVEKPMVISYDQIINYFN